MALKLLPASDPRPQLEAAGLWKSETPLKLAFFYNVPGYINIDENIRDPLVVPEALADLRSLEFPPLSVAEIFITDAVASYDPAVTIAFLSSCASWLTLNGRLTIQVPLGRWKFPDTSLPAEWDRHSLVSLLDYLGLLVGYINERTDRSRKVITLSAVRPERTIPFPPRLTQIQRFIEGPLCSEGIVPPRHLEIFYNRCLAFLGKPPISEPPISLDIQVPTPKPGRLTILHTAEFYAPRIGGAELVVGKVSERLAARGHSVTVATTQIPERSEREIEGVRVEGFDVRGSSAFGIYGTDVRRYSQFLLNYPCDVMMNYAAQQWATDLALPLIRRLRHRVNILAPCGYSAMADSEMIRLKEFFNYFRYTIPSYLPDYDSCIYHSALYHDYKFAERLKSDNRTVIPNAADEDEFTAPPPLDFREKYNIRDKHILLCVANFFEGKGQERAVEVLRALKRPDTALVLIGKKGETLDTVKQKAQGLNVHLLVDIPRIDTIGAFFASDLFLFCSTVEASPLVILESKAARLPFVSTDVGNVREWKGGLICDAKTMHECVNQLLDAPGARAALGLEGWKEFQERHTWTKVVDRYEELYERLHHAKTKAVSGL